MSETTNKFLDYKGLKKYDENIKTEIKNLVSVNPDDSMIIFHTDGSYLGNSTSGSDNKLNELTSEIETNRNHINSLTNEIAELRQQMETLIQETAALGLSVDNDGYVIQTIEEVAN